MGIYERMTVLAFRPQAEVIDLTARNMEIEEFERLDNAANVLVERLQRLEGDRDALDPLILEKIRKEYDSKLRDAERRLRAKRKALTRKLRDMEDARAGLDQRRADLEREIKECEVRRRLGEYHDAVFDMLRSERLSELEFVGRKIEVMARNVDFYRRALAKEKDSFPCASCGTLNLVWESRCRECGADIEPQEGDAARREPAGAAAVPEVSAKPLLEPVSLVLERTLIRDLASIEPMDEEPAGREPLPSERPCLVRIQGPNTGERFELRGGELSIGKAPDNHVSIPEDRALSRRHAKIVYEGGRPVLYDLGSTNGTAVNGRAVEVSPLQNDDEIAMGSSIYRFCA